LRDEFLDAGPLAGLHVAIGAAETPLIAVLAVDMPRIDAAWFRWLLTFCRSDRGAVVEHQDGFEPLAAIYPRDALTTITRRLQRGERSLQQLVAALARTRKMTIVPLPDDQRWRVTNWNTPQGMAVL
jgi:molybdopterin-guanine dinucleotide biosynthesis protein A